MKFRIRRDAIETGKFKHASKLGLKTEDGISFHHPPLPSCTYIIRGIGGGERDKGTGSFSYPGCLQIQEFQFVRAHKHFPISLFLPT